MNNEYNKTISGSSGVNFDGIKIGSGITPYNRTINNTTHTSFDNKTSNTLTLDLDCFITDNLDETVTSREIENRVYYESYKEKTLWESIGETLNQVGATVVVAATSIVSGIADVGEAVLDGGAWVTSKAVGIFSEDGEKAIKEYIARDLVDEANQAFYENTEIGKAINDASAMKYDSELAQGIRSVTEDVTIFVAATSLTVCSGGAASAILPASVGFAYGAGSKAEDVYQEHGTDTTLSQELGIAVSSLGEAANWFAMGKLGQNGLDIFKKVGKLGFKNAGNLLRNGFKSSIQKIGQRSLTQNLQMFGKGMKNLFKGTFNKTTLSRAFSHSIRDIDNLTDSIGIVGDNVAAWLTGDEKFTLQSVLSTTSELGGVFLANMTFSAFGDYLIKAKRLDDIPKMNDTQRQNVEGVFDLEHQVASDEKKYLDNFKTYREHAELHTQAVTDYAVMLGLELDNMDENALAEIYYGAYCHDFGMAGGGVGNDGLQYGLNYNKKNGEFLGLIDEAEHYDPKKTISDIKGQATRDNHPLNSALTILYGDIVPEGLDKNKIALLALSHSKSTSGISSFMDPKQWDAAITKLDDAVKKINQINGLTGADAIVFDADRMRQLISDPSSPEFKQLVDQALCIRDGDAMSDLALTSDGHTIMQTGTVAHVESPKLSLDEKIPNLDDELAAVTDNVTDENGNHQFGVEDKFGKLFHAGEENVNFDSKYDGNIYVGRVELVDAQRVPNSTIFVINERLGELATYTNCDRSFIIELTDNMKNTPYGNSYIDAIRETIQKDIADAYEKLLDGKISEETFESMKNFYLEKVSITWDQDLGVKWDVDKHITESLDDAMKKLNEGKISQENYNDLLERYNRR